MKSWKNESTAALQLPPGPWSDEPDKGQWVDKTTGLDCLIVRNRMGALCGYVGVGPAHPWHGKGYDDVSASVHGGLTFADRCQPHGESEDEQPGEGICHLAQLGSGEENVWWLGFDCSHCYDLSPATLKYDPGFRTGRDVYRDWDYVTAECASLAEQCAAAAA